MRNPQSVEIPTGAPEHSYITALDWTESCISNQDEIIPGTFCYANIVDDVHTYFEQNSDLKFVLLVGTPSDQSSLRHNSGGLISTLGTWLTGRTNIGHQMTNPSDVGADGGQAFNATDSQYYYYKIGGETGGESTVATCGLPDTYLARNHPYQVSRWPSLNAKLMRRHKLKTIQYTRLEMVKQFWDLPIFDALDGPYPPGVSYLDRVYMINERPLEGPQPVSIGRMMLAIMERFYASGIWEKMSTPFHIVEGTFFPYQNHPNVNDPVYRTGNIVVLEPGRYDVPEGVHFKGRFPSHIWFYRGWSGSYGFNGEGSDRTFMEGAVCQRRYDNEFVEHNASLSLAENLMSFSHEGVDHFCNNSFNSTPNDEIGVVVNPWMPTVNFHCTCDLGDLAGPGWFPDNWMNVAVQDCPSAGSVAYVGPSDFHLRTQYNNPMCDGFASGLLDPNIEFFGEVIEYGKRQLFEIYNRMSAPTIEPGVPVNCYDHWYNMWGDPGLPIWRVQPDIITEPNDFILDNNETPITNLLSAQTTINATPLMTSSFRIKPTGEDVDEIVHGTYATIMYADQLIDTVFADEESGLLHFDLINYTEWQNNNEYCNQYLEVPEVEGGQYCDAVDGCAYSTSFPPSETDGCKPVFDVWINKFTLPQYEQKHVQILIDYIYVQGCTDELDQNYNPNAVVYNSEFCSNMSIYENSIVITEINDRYMGTEFIEIFNNSNSPINLGGFRIYAIGFTNTNEMPNITIPPHEFIVLGSPAATIQLDLFNDHLVSGVNLFRWPEGNSIWNQGELIRITDPNNNEVDSVDTSLLLEWHASPQNSSWELTTLTQENGGNAYPDHWIESEFFGGTPGKRYLDWRENAWNHMLTECRGIAQCHDQSPTICQLIWESSDGICMPQYDADEVFSCVRVLELQPLVCEYWVIEFGVCLEGCELG